MKASCRLGSDYPVSPCARDMGLLPDPKPEWEEGHCHRPTVHENPELPSTVRAQLCVPGFPHHCSPSSAQEIFLSLLTDEDTDTPDR